jgi:outer membrane protein assembly factor BamB
MLRHALLVCAIFASTPLLAEETADARWPGWRGPQSNGGVAADDYPVRWSDEDGVALDKRSGEIAWKTPRNYDCPVEGDHGYGTPTVIQHQGRQAVLVWGAEHLTAYDAARGELLWECGGFNPERKGNWVAVASAVVAGEVVEQPFQAAPILSRVAIAHR